MHDDEDDAQKYADELDRITGPEAALRAAAYAQGPHDRKCGHTHEGFAKLVRSFSTMDIVPDNLLLPRFDLVGFDNWMGKLHASGHVYDRRTVTAAFICHAFNNLPRKNIPPFDCKLAIEMWSPPDYLVFLRWVIRPWRG